MSDWKTYYEQTKDAPPSSLLVKALAYVAHAGKAIDIGGGALKDTRYLLAQGFDVTVIDKEEALVEMAKLVSNDKLHATVSSFIGYPFPEGNFDLASAMFALPFNPPDTFDELFARIKNSLALDGIFCGQFFGVHDEWSLSSKMTFHTKEQVEKLVSDLEVISLEEREYDGKIASGSPKHWHVFHVIAKKNRK